MVDLDSIKSLASSFSLFLQEKSPNKNIPSKLSDVFSSAVVAAVHFDLLKTWAKFPGRLFNVEIRIVQFFLHHSNCFMTIFTRISQLEAAFLDIDSHPCPSFLITRSLWIAVLVFSLSIHFSNERNKNQYH